MTTNDLPERETMEFDVVIVGAGPSGLAAAIRLKQVAAETGEDISVVVLEKGSEVGAHILSGAVVDLSGIDALLPDWREDGAHPFTTPVIDDRFYFLTRAKAFGLPTLFFPRLMSNHGAYVVSLGNVCRWLAAKAEALGVEIYPGFAAAELLTDDTGRVIGVATGDLGVGKDGTPGPNYQRGMALQAKYTLIAEGARGSLAGEIIERFGLGEGREVQKYGLGLKELWEIDPAKHVPGRVTHSFGWPLDGRTGGGSFIYHLDDNQVAIGFVVHLNYDNPYLSPFEEFQRFKQHPLVRDTLLGGRRIAYGARALTEGGWQSVPKLTFPGGALIGCSAGFMNVPRIKGSHNAVQSGRLAAEAVAAALRAGRGHDEVEAYEAGWRRSPIGKDLRKVRNVKPLWSKLGVYLGIALGGLDMWTNELFGLSLFGTLAHGKSDAESLKPAAASKPIDYPKPDGVVSFDRLSSVYLSNTNHEEDQPVHLRVRDAELQLASEFGVFSGPSTRYCPAGVYEWETAEGQEPRYVISAQNCVHCKTCDIKDPNGNIRWTVPEGSGGPNYPNM
jgi:electron-transferring-flavoprotein dehydrogenase